MRDGWIETTLGEVAEIEMGQSPSGDTYNVDGIGLPFMQGSAEFGEHHPVPIKWCSSPAKVAEPGDLLLSVRAPVGDTNIADQRIAVGRGLAVLRGGQAAITQFLRIALQVNVQGLLSSSGSGMFSSITGRNLREFRLNIPSIPEQKRITDVVSAVDEYIAALQRQADVARTARNAVLHELLTSGGDDWGVVPLSELLERSIGGVWGGELDSDQVNVTVVRSTEFSKSGILNFETGVPRSIKASQLATRELREGDILLEKSGGGPDQPVGRVVIVEANIPKRFVCSNFIQLLSPKSDVVLPRFLFMVMWNWHRQNKTLEFQAQTTGIRNLRTADYLIEDINLPPLREQNRIVGIISSMDDVIRATESAIVESKNLRSGLLSDLLSGEHEIPASYDRLLGVA